jgi:hypothetical protein
MTGFYEWRKEGSKKVTYRIFLPNEDIFYPGNLSSGCSLFSDCKPQQFYFNHYLAAAITIDM